MNLPHRSPTLRAPPDVEPGAPTVALYCTRRLIGDILAAWLDRAGFRVVGRLPDITALSLLRDARRPDLIVIDAGPDLPVISAALRRLRPVDRRTPVVVIFDGPAPSGLDGAGRGTLVPSSTSLESFRAALHRHAAPLATANPVAGSETTSGELAGRDHAGRDDATRDPAAPAPAPPDLTAEELRTLEFVSKGLSVRRIAALLGTSLGAVEGGKRRIYAKLGVATQSQAVGRAVTLGLIDPLDPAEALPVGPSRQPDLTTREFDILRSIARGDTVRQTARVLAIAEKTVESLKGRLFLKLGTHNSAGAIRAAHALGLLSNQPHNPDEARAAPK